MNVGAGLRADAGGELKRASADERVKFVREIGRLREKVQAVREHYGSTAQLLARKGLGSERRSRLQQQVEKSGPAELASLAAFAAATNGLPPVSWTPRKGVS
ncbi:hypothetical protein [Methylocella sp.]|uniref:hypothetical protein n=1 Tax=Methylocella sp. TaxID=1978226 RepID=UPI0037831713